jgi:hypothetical protein
VFAPYVATGLFTALRQEKCVAVEAEMRFLNLKHEASHVKQLEGNLGGALLMVKFVPLLSGQGVPMENAPDGLQGWQDRATE